MGKNTEKRVSDLEATRKTATRIVVNHSWPSAWPHDLASAAEVRRFERIEISLVTHKAINLTDQEFVKSLEKRMTPCRECFVWGNGRLTRLPKWREQPDGSFRQDALPTICPTCGRPRPEFHDITFEREL